VHGKEAALATVAPSNDVSLFQNERRIITKVVQRSADLLTRKEKLRIAFHAPYIVVPQDQVSAEGKCFLYGLHVTRLGNRAKHSAVFDGNHAHW